MGMVGLRLWWFIFFAMAIATFVAARNTILLSPGKQDIAEVAMETAQLHVHHGGEEGIRRSLKVSLNDYSEPSANHGHDPKNKGSSGSSSSSGSHKSRDTNGSTP
ncbi:uncharacterized protein LOC122083560 [Macadamia integrifolia]|uniref:uncharacterized protein LOC122083560 n=1 Tax=Macadamia integrifolia TaxID=60698 RepID=UPI001C4EE07E|nr:uncharacterized protein LOC122083560 [Macadamia integrifolia]